MKIKVGDWVNQRGRVMRVVDTCDYDKEACWVDDEGIHEYTSVAKKLPIKFKGFDIVDGKIETTKRYSKLYKQTLFFIYDERIHLAMIIGINFIRLWKVVDTPDQARDWLELQYATMIAKARGLI